MGQAKRRRQQLGALYGTPEGSNRPPQGPAVVLGPPALSVELLNTHISRDDVREVVLLLRDGPTSWERSYQPLPEKADQIAAVVVRCDGDRVEVLLQPHPVPASA